MAVPAEAVPATTAVQFDAALIRKFSQQGPRYTSYPAADRFTDEFRFGDFLQAVNSVRTLGARNPLSICVHIPFCDKLYYYCASNKVVTTNRSRTETYLTYLKREIDLQGKLFADMNRVEQLHFGGGTPTYLSDGQMDDLLAHLRRHFRFATDAAGEYSIEIDPRTVSPQRVHALRAQGFNRISLGVQDFDPEVQKAVNRIQSEQEMLGVIRAAREAGFRSVGIELMYGLPKQNLITLNQTLARVIAANPDRIAIDHYVHMPALFRPQRRIAAEDLPNGETRLDMLALCMRRLTDAGYVYIGMDQFARPDDDLAVAQRQGRLHRHFHGYSTHSEAEMLSCGVGAISAVGATYSQNEKTLDAYYERIERGELPIARGTKLSVDDLLRRIIIQALMCNFELSIRSLELAYPITFANHFAAEIEKLRELEADGLLSIDAEWLTVTPKGRLLIHNICMVFDRYLAMAREAKVERMRYAKTI